VVDWARQRQWEDVHEGDAIPTVEFPLPMHRLIVQAGANKDFSAVHHNTEVAQQQGAPEMYANNVFVQGMWERAVREYIGLDGVIKKIGPFRMKTFTLVNEIVVVEGTVQTKWREADENFVEIAMRSRTSSGDSVIGSVTVTLPSAQTAATT
jgi:hypothetical protein